MGSLLLPVASTIFGSPFTVDSEFRDLLLVIYFASLGAVTDARLLRSGGRPLLLLSVLAIALILVQNAAGVVGALAFGAKPGYGLLAGSIPFVGGFGSSVAWSKEFSAVGLTRAFDVSIACSTLGLVLGGIFAGPFIAFLISRHQLRPERGNFRKSPTDSAHQPHRISAENAVYAIGIVALAIVCGDLFREYLTVHQLILPRFLTAMISGVIIANIARLVLSSRFDETTEILGDAVLHSFVIIVLSGVQLWSLADIAMPLIAIAALQSCLTLIFCWLVLFPAMGRNYEAAVMAGATVAYGLSSFAVAMATLKTTVAHHGPAPRAMTLLPLAGAAVVDLANNLLVGLLFQVPWFTN